MTGSELKTFLALKGETVNISQKDIVLRERDGFIAKKSELCNFLEKLRQASIIFNKREIKKAKTESISVSNIKLETGFTVEIGRMIKGPNECFFSYEGLSKRIKEVKLLIKEMDREITKRDYALKKEQLSLSDLLDKKIKDLTEKLEELKKLKEEMK